MATSLGLGGPAGPLVPRLMRLLVSLAPAHLACDASVSDLVVMGFMVALMVGCIQPVASPTLLERGGMPGDLNSFLFQLFKALFTVKKVTDSALYISF